MAQQAKIAEYSGTEIIALSEAKDYLRVDFSSDDSYITELIKIARLQVLNDTNQVVVQQSITEYWAKWPNDDIFCLQYAGKVGSNPTLKYYDDNNAQQPLTKDTDFRTISNTGLIKLQMINTFNLYDRPDAISFTYTVEPENTDVIRTLKMAMYLLIGHYYDNRSAVTFGSPKELPIGYNRIINQYKNYIW